jgi:3-hydroxymyristoyl/3-hydroxydecanoyl-(acyl carrier protein) dehydratase
LPGVAVRVDGGVLSVRSRHLADDHWLAVADQGELHDDGTLTLAGRADRIAKVEGTRVSLTAIERALGASHLVDAVRVVPLQENRDLLGAIVVPTTEGWAALRSEGTHAVSQRLRERLADSTERVALPRRWRWVMALPVNTQGKVTEAEIARVFATVEPAMPPFQVIERSDKRAEVEMHPPRNLVYFDGHFAGTPVLAGVVQLEWAIDVGRTLFGFTGGFVRMEAVKFHRIFQPGPALRLELEWRAERAVLGFRFSSVAGRHSSGRIFFAS